MPNYCDFNMKIKGKKQDCQKWLDKMRDRDGRDCYDEENHFGECGMYVFMMKKEQMMII